MLKNETRTPFLSRRDLLKAGALFSFTPAALWVAPLNAFGQLSREADIRQPASPPWMKDLIVYQIAPKGFTSPNGPASGTFASLRSRLRYLHDLGVNGIWLSGYSLCDSHQFYNIWTQYAVIAPDKFDLTLGTAKEFKDVIDEAHRLDIKVFLDVITHGLMKDSPVIQEHPLWFRGGSWGMKDFDWNGGHADLDDWWVKIYSDFVTRYGVDGFRLDVDIYRPDLWEKVRRNAAAAGHPIVIWEEVNAVIPGVTDFSQRENLIANPDNGTLNEILVQDMPGFYDRKYGRAGYYEVEIHYQDGTRSKGTTKGEGQLSVRLAGPSSDLVGRRTGEGASQPDGLPDVKIALENVLQKPVEDVIVRNDMGEEWHLRTGPTIKPLVFDRPETPAPHTALSKADIYIATLAWGSSLQLSCHDNGWTGYPADKNPYVAQGSRSIFGYSVLFSPMIPIFFAGEEFDATYHPLPELSPYLFGKDAPNDGEKGTGKARWLYGAQLDWNEIDMPRHKDMLNDVKKMMTIRRQYSAVLGMSQPGQMPNLKKVMYEGNAKVPVPYMRWKDRTVVVVAANRDRDQAAAIRLKIDLMGTGIEGHKAYTITDLWSAAKPQTVTKAELENFACRIERDGIMGGGLTVFKIESSILSI